MSKEKKDLTVQTEKPILKDSGSFSALMDTTKFEHLWRVSQVFAKSDLVPAHYKGKPENCMIALSTAMRLQIEPFMMMQTSYIISGKIGLESKLAIALVNQSGKIKGQIQYEYKGTGKDMSCTAFAILKDGDRCEQTVSMKMADAEGWTKKNGSKWNTLPELMLAYRSAIFLIRLHFPEILLGMQTAEELQDVYGESEKDITHKTVDLKNTVATKEKTTEESETLQPEQKEEQQEQSEDETPTLSADDMKLFHSLTNLYHDAATDVQKKDFHELLGFDTLSDVLKNVSLKEASETLNKIVNP